jgi:uncharacterized protein YhaN
VASASELFVRLTLGNYSGLRVGYGDDDTPVLQCLAADGSVPIRVDSLSEGARDQLYLALRLATLRQFCTRNEPLPLILDDVLITFDEARTRAALVVLGELAETTQVLFFTHHERVLELAREAVPKARLREHRLDEGGASASGVLPGVPARAEG